MADEYLTRIATQGHFGRAFDRIVAIATQGHYNSLKYREAFTMTLSITKRDGGIDIVRRKGGITIES